MTVWESGNLGIWEAYKQQVVLCIVHSGFCVYLCFLRHSLKVSSRLCLRNIPACSQLVDLQVAGLRTLQSHSRGLQVYQHCNLTLKACRFNNTAISLAHTRPTQQHSEHHLNLNRRLQIAQEFVKALFLQLVSLPFPALPLPLSSSFVCAMRRW